MSTVKDAWKWCQRISEGLASYANSSIIGTDYIENDMEETSIAQATSRKTSI